MPTTDALKLARDGTLAYGKKRSGWTGLLPVTTAIGYDWDDKAIAECRSWGRRTGEIGYGDCARVVRWETTEAALKLRATRELEEV